MALEGLMNSFGGLASQGGFALQLILGFVTIGVVMYLVWWMFSYNVKVSVYERRGDTTLKVRDKGKVVHDKKRGTEEFKLLKHKRGWDGPLRSKFFTPVKNMLGIGYEVSFRRDEEGNLEPIMPPRHAGEDWGGLQQADVRWAMMNAKEAVQRYSKDDGWEKWISTLAPVISVALVAVVLLIVMQQLEPLAQAFQNAATAFAEAQANAPVVTG